MKESLLANTRCLVKACDELGLKYKFYDDYKNLLEIRIGKKDYLFANTATPFVDDSIYLISKDKGFNYLFLKDEIQIPKTKTYIFPSKANFLKYGSNKSLKELKGQIIKDFKFPFVIKENRGKKGENVFVCKNQEELDFSLKKIFVEVGDYVILVQEFLNIEKEYRAIYFNGEVVLLYEKVFPKNKKHISPFKNKETKAVLLKDKEIIKNIKNFLKKSKNLKKIKFSGLDIVLANNKYYLLECNANPGFSYFVRDNGDEELVKMYVTILSNIKSYGRKTK